MELLTRGVHKLSHSPYHYTPTEWICALFVTLYSITTILHALQAGYFRLWWLFPTAAIGGICEIIGWSARLWSSQNPDLVVPFLIQITTTIMAPTFFVAANFLILGRIIQRIGQQYSRLNANWYAILFFSCDIVALVVQAIGGGMASKAVNRGTSPNKGGNIMLGGIVFQLAAIVAYATLAAEFLIRHWLDKSLGHLEPALPVARRKLSPRMELMIYALCFETLCIFIRSVYRTIELSDGWDGRIISTQVYFNVLDGGMVVLAFFTLNLFHPGLLLYSSAAVKEPDVADKRSPKESIEAGEL